MKFRVYGPYVAVGFLVAVLVFLGQRLRLTDSEIWTFYISRNAHAGFHADGFFWKPLTNLVLRGLSVFCRPFSDEFYLRAGRFFWSLLLIAQIGVLYRIARRLKLDFDLLALGLGLLVSGHYFLNESLKVRADHLSALFLLVFLYVIVDRGLLKKGTKTVYSWALGTLLVLCFLSTPKFAPQIVLMVGTFYAFYPPLRKMFGQILLAVTVQGSLLAGSLGLFSRGSFWSAKLSEIFHLEFFSRVNWPFISNQMAYLFVLWVGPLLLLSKLLDREAEWFRGEKKMGRALATFTLLNSLVVLLHPEPFPWYAATTVPYLCLCSVFFLQKYRRKAAYALQRPFLLAVAAVLVLTTTANLASSNEMARQLEVIAELNGYARLLHAETFFDSTGLLMGLTHEAPFLTGGLETDFAYAEQTLRSHPADLIFRTGRSMNLFPRIWDLMQSQYLFTDSERGIWVHRSMAAPVHFVEENGFLLPKDHWMKALGWGTRMQVFLAAPGGSHYFGDCVINQNGFCHELTALPKHKKYRYLMLPRLRSTPQPSLEVLFSPYLGYF